MMERGCAFLVSFLILGVELRFLQLKTDKFNYGIPCQSNLDCDPAESNLLTCDPYEGICVCEPFISSLDLEMKSCVMKPNYICDPKKLHPCVKNAYCSPENSICTCMDGFLETLDGTCNILAKFGDPCDEKNTSCGEIISEMKCLGGKCQCEFGSANQFHDKETNMCVSYENAECARNCLENTECVEALQRDEKGNISYPLVPLGLRCLPAFYV